MTFIVIVLLVAIGGHSTEPNGVRLCVLLLFGEVPTGLHQTAKCDANRFGGTEDEHDSQTSEFGLNRQQFRKLSDLQKSRANLRLDELVKCFGSLGKPNVVFRFRQSLALFQPGLDIFLDDLDELGIRSYPILVVAPTCHKERWTVNNDDERRTETTTKRKHKARTGVEPAQCN